MPIAILETKAEYRSLAGYAFESKRAFFMESLKVTPTLAVTDSPRYREYHGAAMSDGPEFPRGAFATTRWSLIRRAGEKDPESRQALESLCRIYWPPVYTYIRRRGYDQDAALDLTQGFFTQLLANNYLRSADRSRGKFRSFILTSAKNYLANEWDKQQAQKRGAGKASFSLDQENSSSIHPIEPVDTMTPEKNFERTWALTLLQQVLTRLQQEMKTARSEEYFDQLKACLMGESLDASYKDIAQKLGVSEAALKTRIHRMRRRFGELLYDEVQQTLDSPDHAENEIRYLLTILSWR